MVDNANPVVIETATEREITEDDNNDDIEDEIDCREIFDLLRHINDPEHPLTLEELNVVRQDLIKVDNKEGHISVSFTPTIPHCSMAMLIGLCINVRLLLTLPKRFKVDVMVTPGTHQSHEQISKQLADKERIAAALENKHLIDVVRDCLFTKSKDNS